MLVPPGCPNPPNLTVHAPDATLKTPVAARGCGLAELRVHHLAVLRQHVIEEHLVGPLREQLLVAEDAVVLERPIGGMIHQVEVPRAGVTGFEREAQPLLTLAQCLFGPLTFGDVTGKVNTPG